MGGGRGRHEQSIGEGQNTMRTHAAGNIWSVLAGIKTRYRARQSKNDYGREGEREMARERRGERKRRAKRAGARAREKHSCDIRCQHLHTSRVAQMLESDVHSLTPSALFKLTSTTLE